MHARPTQWHRQHCWPSYCARDVQQSSVDNTGHLWVGQSHRPAALLLFSRTRATEVSSRYIRGGCSALQPSDPPATVAQRPVSGDAIVALPQAASVSDLAVCFLRSGGHCRLELSFEHLCLGALPPGPSTAVFFFLVGSHRCARTRSYHCTRAGRYRRRYPRLAPCV